MQPSEEQIRELMSAVACQVCGLHYEAARVEVLGHQEEMWFLRVDCVGCASRGLVAALIKTAQQAAASVQKSEADEVERTSEELDRPRAAGPITRGDVSRMRSFLTTFDGNFDRLLAKPER